MIQIGQVIRRKRNEMGLTQKEFSKITHTSQSTIAKIEKDGDIKLSQLYLFADALECRVNSLIEEAEDKEVNSYKV